MKTITKDNIHDLQNYLEQEGYTFIVHTFNEKQKYDYIAEYYLRWNANNIKEPIFDIMIRECDGEELPYMVEVIRNVSRIEIEKKK